MFKEGKYEKLKIPKLTICSKFAGELGGSSGQNGERTFNLMVVSCHLKANSLHLLANQHAKAMMAKCFYVKFIQF